MRFLMSAATERRTVVHYREDLVVFLAGRSRREPRFDQTSIII